MRIWCTITDGANVSSSRQGVPVDSGGLPPGPGYPRLMYHATKRPVVVHSGPQEKALGPEWSRKRPEYPKFKYNWKRQEVKVQDAAAEAALGDGWSDSPFVFEAYKGPRRLPTEGREDPCKWVDTWSVTGLSSEHRRKIRADLLRVDGALERSPNADPESAALVCMRQAFERIAQVLFDGGLLTPDLLGKEIPEIVWNSAIAGGWWRRASETRKDIFPERCGHYWIWRGDSWEAREPFRTERREWEARLWESGCPQASDQAAARRQGYRAEVKRWMELQRIKTIPDAAKRLGASESTLKSIMSDRGKCRYGKETLNRILSIIEACPE